MSTTVAATFLLRKMRSCSILRKMNLSRKQIMLLIAANAEVDPRTVRSAYDGNPIRELNLARIAAAAKKLKVPPPPAPKGSAQ